MIKQALRLAEIAVENTAYSFDKAFTYAVPEELLEAARPGCRAEVPFGNGNKRRIGMILGCSEDSPAEKVKELCKVLDKEPLLSAEMLELLHFIKERYYCTLFDAARLLIPAGMGLKLKDGYALSPDFKDFDRESFSELQWQIIMKLKKAEASLPAEKLLGGLGIVEENADFRELLSSGTVRKVDIAGVKIKDATSKMVAPVADFSGKLSPLQRDVYSVLEDTGPVSEKELLYFTGASQSVVKALCQKGAAEIFEAERLRRPAQVAASVQNSGAVQLSQGQKEAFEKIWAEYRNCKNGGVSLLYGVTGSGKTSVFFKLIEKVLADGRAVIVMVPEIALTSQTIAVFSERFHSLTAVMHSGLSLGERFDEWKRVKRGEAKLVIGTRSAVFAPVLNLGLIVIDEEQESSYKSEASPRYDAREIAKFRCYKNNALCLLSSATPSVESYYYAQRKKYFFHMLPDRFGEAKMPEVRLIDMNEQALLGRDSFLSEPLAEALVGNYKSGRQSIVLLNRRGYRTFVSCKSCHAVKKCPHCSISMTYHSANNRLMCHYCGYSEPFAKTCPECGEETLTLKGVGTQKAEQELQALVPQARVLRVDADSTMAKYSLERKLAAFSGGEYDIMVGTQMVAKGLNFEKVTLVGVLSADQSLFSDDFRSAEKTFSLLTQVVGRAGRGKYPGVAMVQTYAPEEPILPLAARQDYPGFFRREIEFRRALLYPPFSDILMLGFVGEDEELVERSAEAFSALLAKTASEQYPTLPMRVLTPAPAGIFRMSGKYRYKIIIKHKNSQVFRGMISQLMCEFSGIREFSKIQLFADINPNSIM